MRKNTILFSICISLLLQSFLHAQHSVARQWNDVLLEAIRNDFARPTVHARNLFHTSVAMYDAWAVFDNTSETFFLGKTVNDFHCNFEGIESPADKSSASNEILSYAVYRLLVHRFYYSPGVDESYAEFDSLMNILGYDKSYTSTNYSDGNFAALGNYLGQKLIEFGVQDGSNEENDYTNLYYTPLNTHLEPGLPGNPNITDPNRWQPLLLDSLIDQSGHLIPGHIRDFLSPEWGQVVPFALKEHNKTITNRDGYDYWVYNDPGPPPYLDTTVVGGLSEEYKWGFSLVSVWSAHMDPADNVMWDISPGAIGNIPEFPKTWQEYHGFYDLINGGDPSLGHDVNPYTGSAYEPQMVPRADYARVLAEFWADGPDSETPPGHWFSILNYVNDHSAFEKKYKGEGEVLDDFEWDVKSYFTLGGAVHDAAISAWGIKGCYDYIRPVSAIRYMADKGQSADANLANYHPAGIPLIDGYIELVDSGDPLAGDQGEHKDKIKLLAWQGPDYIEDPETDIAGVDWILAENWWPYQRPSFVTPPFAGYVSGHSTFSRAAAEVMTFITGDAYFPGGLGEFVAKKNEFLVFEEGPSVDIVLQWATYRDASDQTSLSRIWGGIHPPADDIPGRIIGEKIGIDAFELAEKYFNGTITALRSTQGSESVSSLSIYPHPVINGSDLNISFNNNQEKFTIGFYNVLGQLVQQKVVLRKGNVNSTINTRSLSAGIYFLRVDAKGKLFSKKVLVIK